MKFGHKLVLFLFLLFLFVSLSCYVSFRYVKEYNDNLSKYNLKEEYKEICEGDTSNLEVNQKNICETMYPYEDGFMYAHSLIVVKYLNIFPLVIIVVIMAFSLLYPSILLKSRFYINELSRKKYKNILGDIIKNTYIYIIPVVTMILLIFIVEIYNFGIDNTYAILNEASLWNYYALSHPIIFILIYTLNIAFFIATYINLGLIVVRKYKKYFPSLITAFLLLVIIQLFLEVVIKKQSILSLINIFRYNDNNGFLVPIIFSFTCFIITTALVCFAYYNKEKLINDYKEAERNE